MRKQSTVINYHAAGGVVTNANSTHVLLLIRPARDEVRLPKGHVEPEEAHNETALREVAEETGYTDVEILSDLGEQMVAFPLNEQKVQRTEHYFLMRARSLQKIERPPADDQQFFPVWTTWEEAYATLTFEMEKEWVKRAHKALK
ncbi:MAG: NUDIX domain-containing protein [Anaerolineae bacterium]|nr:NUDIX domain-containing protein [Anaerolineae bacterium]